MLDMKPMPKMNKQPVAGAYGMRLVSLPDSYLSVHILIGTYAKCLHHPSTAGNNPHRRAWLRPLHAFTVWQAFYKSHLLHKCLLKTEGDIPHEPKVFQ
jgi:hypothetical protein